MPEPNNTLNIPEVFFETAGKNQRPATTLLYSLEPKGIGTGQCESLKSYMHRLANAHRLRPMEIIEDVLYGQLYANQLLGPQKKRQDTLRNSWYVSTGTRAQMLVKTLATATGVNNLVSLTMLPVGHVLSTVQLITDEHRYCPKCAEENNDIADTYDQLIWLVKPVEACPIHGVKLLHKTCEVQIARNLRLFTRASLPGVCLNCGSLGFKCNTQKITPATDAAIWKAKQVAELISIFPREERLFSPRQLRTGLNGVVSRLAEGRSAVAARMAGINKSVMCHWIHGKNLPNLSQLLDLCLMAKLSLVSVMHGDPKECISPNYKPMVVRTVRIRTAVHKREAALQTALETDTPESLSALSRKLGVDRKLLREQFPSLCQEIVNRFRRHQQEQKTLRQRLALEYVTKVADEMRMQKRFLSKRNLERSIGMNLYPKSVYSLAIDKLLAEQHSC